MTSLKKKSLSEELAGRIRDAIVNEEYLADDKLPTEPELMTHFEVSRSTVREAMRMLSNSGWVRIQQGVGTFVEARAAHTEPLFQRLKRGDEQDLEEVRNLLERKIIEKAAVYRTDEDIDKMRGHLAERKKHALSGDTKSCIEVDVAFHTALARASGNSILADLYEAFAIRLKASFSSRFQTVESFEQTQKLHEELLKHIEMRSPKKAIEILDRIVSH